MKLIGNVDHFRIGITVEWLSNREDIKLTG